MRTCIGNVIPAVLVHTIIASALSFPSRSAAPPSPLSRANPFGIATAQTQLRSEDSTCNSAPDRNAPSVCSLRIILINDVYELHNWPKFRTAVRDLTKGNTIVVLAGDFVGPSLLSSYDNARGMIDTMNHCGIQYVCFGNHETDIPHSELIKRIKESNFRWINSNIENLDLDGISLPSHVVIDVEGGGQSKRVGLLGLVTEDPNLYQPGAFNGATIKPLADAAESLRARLLEQDDVDLIIPITHQSILLDRDFARRFEQPEVQSPNAFPLILGGHDHTAYSETVAGAHIVKTSCDLHELAVCDLVWPGPDGARLEVNTTFVPITPFEPDPYIEHVVAEHLQVLTELDRAPLFLWGEHERFSSKNNRLQETGLCKRLASETRDALGSECCLINAGNIRGNREYEPGKPFFSYNDLRAEVPFDCEVVVVRLPGRVLQAAVAFSRRMSLTSSPLPDAAFLHLDDRMRFDPVSQRLTHVAGDPFDEARTYETAILLKLLTGVDNIEPLVAWAREHAEELLELVSSSERAPRRLKSILVESWSRALWWELSKALPWRRREIRREEVQQAAAALFGEGLPAQWVSNVMRAADAETMGRLAPAGMLAAALFNTHARAAMGWDGRNPLTRKGLRAGAVKLLPDAHGQQAVQSIWQHLGPAEATDVPARVVAKWMASHATVGQVCHLSLPCTRPAPPDTVAQRPWVPGETSEREELRASVNELQVMRGSRPVLRAHSVGRGQDDA